MQRPAWWVHTAVVVGAVVLFMAASAWAAAPWWEFAFLSDGSPVAWLSSALLMANAAVALRLAVDRSVPWHAGGAMTAGLVALALDEQFLLHEQLKELAPRPVADWPTWTMGIGAVVVAWVAWRAFPAAARLLLLSAVLVALFALWVDLGNPPPMVASLEEGYEVLAEALFLSGLLAVPSRQVQSAC